MTITAEQLIAALDNALAEVEEVYASVYEEVVARQGPFNSLVYESFRQALIAAEKIQALKNALRLLREFPPVEAMAYIATYANDAGPDHAGHQLVLNTIRSAARLAR